MTRCAFIKHSGERCKGRATEGSEWCWNHDPAHADERRRHGARGGKRGGRGRPQAELAGIKALLSDLTDRVLKAEGTEPLETGPAAVANQLINTRLRAVEIERKVKETDELEARLEALEQAGEHRKGGQAKPWGA